jgi:hypothetical protein
MNDFDNHQSLYINRCPSNDTVMDSKGNAINVGVSHNQYVYIEKVIGATCADSIRVHMNLETAEWIIERQRDYPCKGHDLEAPAEEHHRTCKESIWEVIYRVYCQEAQNDYFDLMENNTDKKQE